MNCRTFAALAGVVATLFLSPVARAENSIAFYAHLSNIDGSVQSDTLNVVPETGGDVYSFLTTTSAQWPQVWGNDWLTWSPDAKKVFYKGAYLANPTTGESALALYSTTAPLPSTPVVLSMGTGNPGGFNAYSAFAVTPDGASLIYTGGTLQAGDPNNQPYLLKLPVTGGMPAVLVTCPVGFEGPRVIGISPDGTKVAYSLWDPNTGIADLVITNIDRAPYVETHIDTNVFQDVRYSWSADSNTVAYLKQNANGSNDVWLAGLTTAPVNLTAGQYGSPTGPTFSPNGSLLGFVSGGQVMVMTLANGSVASWATGATDVNGSLAWSPDSTRIAYAYTIGGWSTGRGVAVTDGITNVTITKALYQEVDHIAFRPAVAPVASLSLKTGTAWDPVADTFKVVESSTYNATDALKVLVAGHAPVSLTYSSGPRTFSQTVTTVPNAPQSWYVCGKDGCAIQK